MRPLTVIFDTLFTIGLRFLTFMGSVPALYYSLKYSLEQRKLCSKISNQILLLSASELTEKIRTKQLKCEEVIKAYIQRVKEVNPIINAVVEDRFDIAIQEAKKYDLMLSSTDLTETDLKLKFPLLGVPVTIKESIGVEGMSHCAGLVRLKNVKAHRDAEVVRLIKEAGGIILLVSNTPELCADLETHNLITGSTRNPYDSRRTPSGSSGGEAALIASGASLIGIGSDMLGSIRVPALFCGIWGHKPSAYIVSLDNHSPLCKDPKLEDILTIGPLTRYQVDLPLVLNVILKENSKKLVNLNKSTPLQHITVYYSDDYTKYLKIDPEINDSLKKVLDHLRNKCTVKKISYKKFNPTIILLLEYLGFFRNFTGLFEQYPDSYFLEILYYLMGKSNLGLKHITLALTRKIFFYLPDSVLEDCRHQIQQMKDEFHEVIGENGIFISPTNGSAATYRGQSFKKILDYELTSIFNLIGCPATHCPLGLNKKGLPIGIQIAAASNKDGLCLTVAEEINKMWGGWTPPEFAK